jgi:tripartite-type tricarboxylate transporter receptor subunit TctC
VKIIAPLEPGGTVDSAARLLAKWLNVKWRVPAIVENRPGAGDTAGGAAVAHAPLDGYTLVFVNTSISVNPSGTGVLIEVYWARAIAMRSGAMVL